MIVASITIGGAGLRTIVVWLVIGLVAGFLASLVVRGRGLGLIGDIIVGLLGALLGGFLASLIGLSLGLGSILSVPIGDVVIAFLGACLLLLITRFFRRRGGRR